MVPWSAMQNAKAGWFSERIPALMPTRPWMAKAPGSSGSPGVSGHGHHSRLWCTLSFPPQGGDTGAKIRRRHLVCLDTADDLRIMLVMFLIG